MQRISYPNGDEYYGHVNARGQRHGQGDITTPNYRYIGAFRDGMRDGHGRCWWPDDATYDGAWRDDRPEGYGTGILLLGQYFDGEFVEGILRRGLLRFECVVDDCLALPMLARHQRLISRDLASQLGRPAGDCTLFVACLRTQNIVWIDGGVHVSCTGTLVDEDNNGPVISGVFRETMRDGLMTFDIVDPDMPHLAAMTPEEEALAVESRAALKKQEQLERLARRRAEIAAAAAAQRQDSIAKGRIKLAKFMNSKGNKGGRGKSRRKMRTKRRKHVGGFEK